MNNPPRKVTNFLKKPIVFFCKDCEKIVDVKPLGRKFVYRCGVCGTKNVAFGTEKTIINFYRVPEDVVEENAGVTAPAQAPSQNPSKKS